MKLDIDFIKEIMSAIENNAQSQTTIGEMLNTLHIEQNEGLEGDKFIGHIKLLRDANFISSEARNGGIMNTGRGYVVASEAKYEMTLRGYQMLDALRSDNLMGKVKNYLSEVGVSGLKNAPGFLIGIATNYILKS